MKGLEMGAVEKLIVWENLSVCRYTLRNNSTGETTDLILRPEQKERAHFMDKTTNIELELLEEQLFLDFLTLKYKDYGAVLEIVSDKSAEGSQFVKGFGGIGGILRYKVDFQDMGGDLLDSPEEDDFNMEDY